MLIKAWASLRDSSGVKRACRFAAAPPAAGQAAAVGSLVRGGDPDGGQALARRFLAGRQTEWRQRSDFYCYVFTGPPLPARFKSAGDLQKGLATTGVEFAKGFCLALREACESPRAMHREDALLNYAERKGISRDASDLLTVLSGCGRDGRLDEACAFFAQMKAPGGCRPDAATRSASD